MELRKPAKSALPSLFHSLDVFEGALVNTIRMACAAIGALSALAIAPEATAMEGWLDGAKPVFRSDILREQRDRDRMMHRVRFPPYMTGGSQPAIAPEAPPRRVAE
jgi:hypothetical protein